MTADDREPPSGGSDDRSDGFEEEVRAALRASAGGFTADPDLAERVAVNAAPAWVGWPARAALAAAAIVVVVLVASIAVGRDEGLDLSTSPGTDPAPSSTSSVVPTSSTEVTGPGSTIQPVPDPSVAPPAPSVPAGGDGGDILGVRVVAGVEFGGSTAAAEQAITDRIGPPVGRYEQGCAERTIISWGSFALWDQGGRVTEWSLIGDAGLGLRTDRGIGIGATAGEVEAAYPEAMPGELSLEEPVRSGFSVTDESGNVAWAAVLGDDDRVIAMRSSPGDLYPLACGGQGVTYLSLAPHLGGLGPLLFGTPAERVEAVLGAIHGTPSRSVDEVPGMGRCSTLTTLTYTSRQTVEVLVTGTGLMAFVVGPIGPVPASIVAAPGVVVSSGMTVAEASEVMGTMGRVTGAAGPDGEHPVSFRGSEPSDTSGVEVVARADGTGDDSHLTKVGAIRYGSCS